MYETIIRNSENTYPRSNKILIGLTSFEKFYYLKFKRTSILTWVSNCQTIVFFGNKSDSLIMTLFARLKPYNYASSINSKDMVCYRVQIDNDFKSEEFVFKCFLFKCISKIHDPHAF